MPRDIITSRLKKKLSLLLLLCISELCVIAQLPSRVPDPEFKVGYANKIIETVNLEGRPVKVQISQWYPITKISKKVTMKPFLLADYGVYSAYRNKEILPDYNPSPGGIDILRKFLLQFSKDEYSANQLINSERDIFADVAPKKGKWPLLLYVSSLNAEPSENFWLFEYLASKGYIIMGIPSVGKDSIKSKFTRPDIESQYHAISTVLQFAKKQSFIDTTNIFAGGFSLGGISAALLALNYPDIKALITLDGTMSYRYSAIKELLSNQNQILSKPYLQLNQRSIKRLPLDTSFFNKHSSRNAHLLQFAKLDHIDHASLFILAQSLETDSSSQKRQMATYGKANTIAEKQESHVLMCRVIYDFLQSLRRQKKFSSTTYDKHYFEFTLSK